MRRPFAKNFTQLLLLVMIIASLAVTACLAGKAAKLEKQASDLSRAVILAESAADAFYKASTQEELEKLLSLVNIGNPENGGKKTSSLRVEIHDLGFADSSASLGQNRIQQADLTVLRGEELIYTLRCEKGVPQ